MGTNVAGRIGRAIGIIGRGAMGLPHRPQLLVMAEWKFYNIIMDDLMYVWII